MKNILKKIITYLLQIEARLALYKYKPRVIAITGSIGKTSTKDALYAVLSKFAYVRKSDKSYNSEIGLPLTVLGVPNAWMNPLSWFSNLCRGLWLFLYPHRYPSWLVLEVGVGKPRDIERTASWLHSDVVIITAIGGTPAHIEFFPSRKHLIDEKSTLIKTLKKDGLLILNADDPDVLAMRSKTKSIVLTYGFNPNSDILASSESISYNSLGLPTGIIFRVDHEGNSLPVAIDDVFGRNHLYAALAAVAFAYGLKLNIIESIDALKDYDIPPGRMRLLLGINNSLIIDDTYNSSPLACGMALKTLGRIKSFGRKVAILGDMLELGKHTLEAHKNIGRIAKENVDMLLVVGQRAKAMKEGALESDMDKEYIFDFLDARETASHIANDFINKGDIILVKGSQSMRMERVVEAILADKKNKARLLVRQDPEWLKKN